MSNHFIKPENIARSFARASGMTPASDLKPASWITAEMDLSTGENRIRTSEDIGAEEKPYKPLVDFRHYGQNSHSIGRGYR